jgi:two-component system response regulator AtoC
MPTDLNERLRVDTAELPEEAVIFGGTAAMRELRSKIDSALSSDLPVLVEGESGTGKEVMAQFLHARSSRGEAPFLKLNCAGMPAGLLESELFGSVTGTKGGAGEERPGLVETAGDGTVFLNEIGAMSLELQDKLLNLLRDGTFTRVGSGEQRMARVRLICATNVSLHEAVQAGAFREDLFDRLNVLSLRLPPLRERKLDIPEFCEYLLQKLSRRFRRLRPQLSEGTVELLMRWDWPGNLRELENWIARAVILGGDEALVLEMTRQLKPSDEFTDRRPRMKALSGGLTPAASLVTGALLLKALQANRWNRRKTADELKLSYRALLFRLRNVGGPQKRRSHRGPPRAS